MRLRKFKSETKGESGRWENVRWQSDKVIKWESGIVIKWESGKVGKWSSESLWKQKSNDFQIVQIKLT